RLEPRMLFTAATYPLTAAPALHSLSGAVAKLYLDFNGDTNPQYHTTPAYDRDGNPASFNDQELSDIQEIWARVAERYSPFKIDVTTVDPGNIGAAQTGRI